MPTAEVTALDDVVYGLEYVRGVKFEGTGEEESRKDFISIFGEVDNGVMATADSEGLWVGVEMISNIGIHHTPQFRLQREQIGVGNARSIDYDALMHIIVDHSALLQELRKRKCGDACVRR